MSQRSTRARIAAVSNTPLLFRQGYMVWSFGRALASGQACFGLFASAEMELAKPAEVTGLLRAWSGADQSALIDDFYLWLVDVRNVEWQHRARFCHLRPDHAQHPEDAAHARGSHKGDGDMGRIDMEDAPIPSPEPGGFILSVDWTLAAFSVMASRQVEAEKIATERDCTRHGSSRPDRSGDHGSLRRQLNALLL